MNRDLAFHGGVANVLLTLASGYEGDDAEISFGCMMSPSAELVEALRREGASVDCIGDFGFVPPALRLRALIKARQIDVVVPCSFRATVVAYLATRGLGVRVVPYLHAIDGVIEGRARRRVFDGIMRDAPMMFVSRAVLAAHRPRRHSAPVAVVHNGVRDPFADPLTAPYGPERRGELGVPDDALLLGYLAAFVPVKDHPTLLAAFERLDPALNAHLVMIGHVGASSDIEARVERMDTQRVQIVPPRTDARQLLGVLDIYVHTSTNEGFGLAIVEAMLAGRPVVAVGGGAVPEFIEDGVNGLLAEPGDADGIAAAITRLACDPELRRTIAETGQREARERFGAGEFSARVMSFLVAIVEA